MLLMLLNWVEILYQLKKLPISTFYNKKLKVKVFDLAGQT